MECKKKFRYDLFMSFKGDDTRYNFIHPLYNELVKNGFTTFLDEKSLKQGEVIKSTLLNAIDDSEAFIVVMSKNYPNSGWCLVELDRIVCTGRLILPVFYDVDPSDVRHQKGPFEAVFLMLEQYFHGENSYVGLRLKNAMMLIGGIEGWDTRKEEETEVIQSMVKRLLLITKSSKTPTLGVTNQIVIGEGSQLILNLNSNCLDTPLGRPLTNTIVVGEGSQLFVNLNNNHHSDTPMDVVGEGSLNPKHIDGDKSQLFTNLLANREGLHLFMNLTNNCWHTPPFNVNNHIIAGDGSQLLTNQIVAEEGSRLSTNHIATGEELLLFANLHTNCRDTLFGATNHMVVGEESQLFIAGERSQLLTNAVAEGSQLFVNFNNNHWGVTNKIVIGEGSQLFLNL